MESSKYKTNFFLFSILSGIIFTKNYLIVYLFENLLGILFGFISLFYAIFAKNYISPVFSSFISYLIFLYLIQKLAIYKIFLNQRILIRLLCFLIFSLQYIIIFKNINFYETKLLKYLISDFSFIIFLELLIRKKFLKKIWSIGN